MTALHRVGVLRAATLVVLGVLLAACASSPGESATDIEEQADGLAQERPSALKVLTRARRLDSPAGSALDDNEAYDVALGLCSPGSCQPPDAVLTRALDDVAVNTRVASESWWNLRGHLLDALHVAPTNTPATIETWQSLKPSLHELSVPIFVVGGSSDGHDGVAAFRSALASRDGAVFSPSATGYVDGSGKLVAVRVVLILNPCNGCADELDITIGVDGSVLKNEFNPDPSYCC